LEGEVDMAALVASQGAGVFASQAEPAKFAHLRGGHINTGKDDRKSPNLTSGIL
jgi:hypothetical protein